MFTGLVETTGILEAFTDTPEGRTLRVAAPDISPTHGESIAVNGCCLTVAAAANGILKFDLLAETLRRTNLGALAPGRRVNLERALAASARLGGHFVQGHIDAAVPVLRVAEERADLGLTFALPPEFARYVIAKGSIAINGVSLTVADLDAGSFRVWIIPHTRASTNLGELTPGDAVNIEFDILAKYAERILTATAPAP
jgi:riboflavin synthase